MTINYTEVTSKDFDNVAAPVIVRYPKDYLKRDVKKFRDSLYFQWVPVIANRLDDGWFVKYYPCDSWMVKSYGQMD